MIARMILIAVVATLTNITPAAAKGLFIYWPDGSVSYLPHENVVMIMAFIVSGVVLIIKAIVEATGTTTTYEVSAPQTAQSYHDEADRIRAMARKIDAEAQLAESYINAMRTRGQLEELPEILQHDQTMRRR
jgi:hypothetical protein